METTASTAPAAESPRPAPAAPAAERRLVTVLFADLVGFTPFAEGRDIEDVREILSLYYGLASEVIGRHGGTVEKFIGDAVMAAWGVPAAGEDDAERAVRAGLELVAGMPSLGTTMQARVGIVSGEAAVTVGAVGQGMVAGDVVNTASRLQTAAPPGAVLVGEATMRAASRAIAFEPAGRRTLRGKTAPVAAWRAIAVVAERRGRGRSDVLEPPFVGRGDELRVLKEALHATGRDRRPRLVSITGAPGIGKSRLIRELERYVDGIVEPVYWHVGRSPAHGDGVAAWALGEMVRGRAGLAEGDDEATTRAALGRLLDTWIPEPGDRRLVAPALLTLLGLAPAPPDDRDVLFAGWRILFERIAAAGTTVLVFEDLQWADGGALDFIGELLGRARSSPILVLAVARPELLDRRPDLGAGRVPSPGSPSSPSQRPRRVHWSSASCRRCPIVPSRRSSSSPSPRRSGPWSPLASTPSIRPSGRFSWTPRSWVTASPSAPSPWSAAHRPTLSGHACSTSSATNSWRSTSTRARRSEASSPSRTRSSERSRTGRSPGPIAAPVISPPPGISSRSAPTRSPALSLRMSSRRAGTRPPAPRRTRSHHGP